MIPLRLALESGLTGLLAPAISQVLSLKSRLTQRLRPPYCILNGH
jgi:hypothetical protein